MALFVPRKIAFIGFCMLVLVLVLLWSTDNSEREIDNHRQDIYDPSSYDAVRKLLPTLTNFEALPQESSESEKDRRIKELEYLCSMLLARSSALNIEGPAELFSLPKIQTFSFNRHRMKILDIPMVDGTGGHSSPDQAPPQVIANGLMERTQDKLGWEKKWSRKLVDGLISAVQNNEDISPRDYPCSALQIQQALEDYVRIISNARVMVGGSISPWIESIVLATTGVSKVHVVDYQPIDMGDEDRIECLLMADIRFQKPEDLFDVIISFSSIEHDGLGRYGDPINPDGDMAAMAEFYTLLNSGGILLLGIPHYEVPGRTGGIVAGNSHRLYSQERIRELHKGFEVIDVIKVGTEELAKRFHKPFDERFCYIKDKGTSFRNQPILVLRKKTDEVPSILQKVLS